MTAARVPPHPSDMPESPTTSLPNALIAQVRTVVLGKDPIVEHAITALLAGGHLLVEDKPGVGKTLLARALARALDLPFQRIQCTADLLPTDILGGPVYHPTTGELIFRPGPVFTSVLVADELNRTPPRTQSALLECMAEGHVTLDRERRKLPDPFFVVATQNPLAFAGTYPLPESQLDRFLLRVGLGYPEPEDELAIVAREDGHKEVNQLEPAGGVEDVRAARAAVDRVHVDPSITAWVVEVARRTRETSEVELGVSTRGAQALHRACRARAVLRGRDFATPDDAAQLVEPVFAHRMSARGGADPAMVLASIAETVPMPS